MKNPAFYKRIVLQAAALSVLLLVVSIGIAIKTTHDTTEDAWGQVALSPVDSVLRQVSPLPFANACGLGASSCFRCHNGKRAEAPSDDAWHTDHAKVNFSCAGCHNGNPRIIKQAIAHKDMIPDPRTTPEQSCSSCHKGDVSSKLANYHQQAPAAIHAVPVQAPANDTAPAAAKDDE